ncbi:MAG: 2,3-bisphosphoglycerate-independent phosphoglycerate mutase, partial [Patescibacteria group bacterium]|nr:2,3-bisphosphoglycerate-independent phosphoglycerate mutase [Patescibacteria group bacterium]
MERDVKAFEGRPRPAVLLVLDGFGVAPDGEGNAITRANTPTFKMLTERYPTMTLRASGDEVGLSWGEMGNSEVGHLAIGAGRVYYQTLPRINKAIVAGTYANNPAFAEAIAKVKETGGTLHLMGLMSSGKVHAFDDHAFQLLKIFKKAKVKDVAVHAVLDGRDTLYNSGIDFIRTLEEQMKTTGVGYLASM